jgi:uncharacterized protein (UPF0333 family)
MRKAIALRDFLLLVSAMMAAIAIATCYCLFVYPDASQAVAAIAAVAAIVWFATPSADKS